MSGSGPSGRSGHTATLIGGGSLLLVFGGQAANAEGRIVALNDMHVLDIESGKWMQPEQKGLGLFHATVTQIPLLLQATVPRRCSVTRRRRSAST
jgi:hypothetical protein